MKHITDNTSSITVLSFDGKTVRINTNKYNKYLRTMDKKTIFSQKLAKRI